jgi:hypothetical protein
MRVLLSLIFVALSCCALAQNTLLNPPGTVDDLVLLEGAQALMQGARAENVRPSADGSSIELVDGARAGSLTLQVVRTRFAFNEAIPSWNGYAPAETGFRVWMNPILANRVPCSWFDAGTWGRISDELTTRVIPLNCGVYNIDTLLLNTLAEGMSVRFDLVRASTDSPSPKIYLFAFSYSNSTGNQQLARRFGADRVVRPAPAQVDVPYFSQVVKRDEWIGRICSPCSVNMALARFGIRRDTQSLATELYDPVSDAFGVWHRSVQGASQHGVRGYITRFRTWGQVSEALSRGYVVCASIRFKAGEVNDPMLRHGRRKKGTEGHLITITGIRPDGTVTVHDTASKDYGVNSVWTQDDLAKAWFDKGGVSYVFTGTRG